MSALEQLSILIPPPAHVIPDHREWARVEGTLGCILPNDYKRLVDLYGEGAFDDFIWVLQPESDNENIDLVVQRTVCMDALRVLEAGGERVPFDVADSTAELLPWAISDNGDVFYWTMRRPDDPDRWTTAINEARGPQWVTFDGTATECLLALLSKSFVTDLLPADFPSEKPTFSQV